MKCRVIITGPSSAEKIMTRDEAMLDAMEENSTPIIHFYDWERPAATYGYFFKPEEIMKTNEGLDLARRPTGGGLLFHVTDFAFSVLLPKQAFVSGTVIDQYRLVNGKVIEALQRLFPAQYEMLQETAQEDRRERFCMTLGTKYDVLVDGRKVVGAAQRTKPEAVLHQGTVSLALPNEELLRKYLPDHIVDRMLSFTHAPLCEHRELDDVRQELRRVMQEVFT